MSKGYSWISKNFDVLEKRLMDEEYTVNRNFERDLDRNEHLIIKTTHLHVKSDNLSGAFYPREGTLSPTSQANELNSKDERLLQLFHNEYRHKHIPREVAIVIGAYITMIIGALSGLLYLWTSI